RSITKRCTKTSEPASPPDPGRGFLRGGQRLQRNHDFSIHNEKNEMPAKEAFRCFRGFRCFRDSVGGPWNRDFVDFVEIVGFGGYREIVISLISWFRWAGAPEGRAYTIGAQGGWRPEKAMRNTSDAQ